MERVDNFFSFLISVGSLWASLHLVWCWLLACSILRLLCLGVFLVSLLFQRPLSWRDVIYCRRLFQHLMTWLCVSFSVCLYGGLLDILSYVELSLHFWDEADLIMVSDFSDMFLDSVCQYFTENFCNSVHEWDWSVIFFVCNVFLWLGYQGNCSFIKRVW